MESYLLSKGVYYFNLNLFQDDVEGNMVALDFVNRAFYVEIIEECRNSDEFNIWYSRGFGYIHYPDLKILD